MVKIKESFIEAIFKHLSDIDYPGWKVTGAIIGNPEVRELDHSPEIIKATKSKPNSSDTKIVINIELEFTKKQ
jgi:hypothetical protein